MDNVTSLDQLVLMQKMVSFYIQEHMKPYYSNEVARALLYIEKYALLFSKALLCDVVMQSVCPTALATGAYSFGLLAASTTAMHSAAMKHFSPKDVLVVQEAWRSICREVISSQSVEEMEEFMIEMAQRLSYLRVITKGNLNEVFPPDFVQLLPPFQESWNFERIL